MPKLKVKTRTATLYTYVTPINDLWVRKTAKKEGLSYSEFVDQMIARARHRKKAVLKSKSKAA